MHTRVIQIKPNTYFKARNGWLTRFCTRFKLTSKRITGSDSKCLEMRLIWLINTFEIWTTYKQSLGKFELKQIFGFDETTFYSNMPGNYTYELVGSQRVLVSTIIKVLGSSVLGTLQFIHKCMNDTYYGYFWKKFSVYFLI